MKRFLLLSVSAMILASVVTARPVKAWTVDEYGRLVSSQAGVILGRGSEDQNRSGDSSGSGSDSFDNRSGSSGSSNEGVREKVETTSPVGTEVRSETRPEETKTEIRFPDSSRIKTETREDRTRSELRQSGVKVRLEQKAGEIRLKVENEDTGEEQELPPETDEEKNILTIRERADKDEVKVSTASGRLVIKRNSVGATSAFPLSVDLKTNALTVTTPAGEKQVTVLPDQAVRNLLTANVIDHVGGQALNQLVADNPDLSSLSGIIQLTQTPGGRLAYEIQGVKNRRLLGFIPVTLTTTAVVSAETGELLQTQQPLANRVLDLVSF